MAQSATWAPLALDQFDRAAARHLLYRVGLGGTPTQVRELADRGLDGAITHLLDYQSVTPPEVDEPNLDPSVIRPPTPEEREIARRAYQTGDQDTLDAQRRMQLAAQAQDRRMIGQLRDWWLNVMVVTPRPAEERLTFLWHSHFASSQRSVRDTWLMWQQHLLFRAQANGSFARIAAGIVRDPAMIKYLNNDRNIARRPNENLARELMELFTLGEGNYSENDIKEGARALTGYDVQDNDFVFRKRDHDDLHKEIFGQKANYDGDDFVRLLVTREACARLVALKLYDTFVADVGEIRADVPPEDRKRIDALARQLYRDKLEVGPTLKLICRSEYFYSPAVVGRKIKDPLQLAVGSVRSLAAPVRRQRRLTQALQAMGLNLFEPPTVDGWDGGRGWINTSTLFVRQNYTTYLLTGTEPESEGKLSRDDYDPFVLLAELDDRSPAAAVDHLVNHLLGFHVPPARREPLLRFMAQREKGLTHDSLTALLCLITAMPEYQLC